MNSNFYVSEDLSRFYETSTNSKEFKTSKFYIHLRLLSRTKQLYDIRHIYNEGRHFRFDSQNVLLDGTLRRLVQNKLINFAVQRSCKL